MTAATPPTWRAGAASEQITPDDITRVTAQYLHPELLTTLVVGDLAAVSHDLAGLDLGTLSVLSADTF